MPVVSEIFDESAWSPVQGFELTDITYHRAVDSGMVRVAFDRPEVRNAFRPRHGRRAVPALDHARAEPGRRLRAAHRQRSVTEDGGWAFCSGGDQRIRGRDGYRYAEGETARVDPAPQRPAAHPRGAAPHPLHAQGGDRRRSGLGRRRRTQRSHVVCDLTIASANTRGSSRPTPTWPASTAGSAPPTCARQVGQKFAREIFFLGDEYTAEAAHRMGMVNAVVPHAELESVALEWGAR